MQIRGQVNAQYTEYAAPKGSFTLNKNVEQRLNSFFADTRGEVDGVRKTAQSVTTKSSPLIREDGQILNYPENIRDAVLAASEVATGQYSAANGVKEGQAFWPEETHFINVNGKDLIAAQFKDNVWGRQSKEVITLVDPQTAQVVALKSGGDWFSPPFTRLPTK
ncbi:MAG: hypothetical protein K1X64_01640 [Myxococcaceae bacterium]|nr:hypothetical protein [Myxococcaceae bacterium]